MNKKSLILGIIIVLLFTVVGFLSIQKLSPTTYKRGIPGLEIWKQSTLSLNANIANSIVDYVIDNDHFVLGMYESDIKDNITGFQYLIIINKEGKILTHSDSTQILQDYQLGGLNPLGDRKNLIQYSKEKEIYDIATPIMLEDIRVGEVHLGLKNPWIGVTEEQPPNNLVKILFIAAAFIGIILSIVGAIGTAAPSKTTGFISKEQVKTLERNKQELESKINELKKEFSTFSKKKGEITGDEDEINKRIATLRMEEAKLLKNVDEKKAMLEKFEESEKAISLSVPSSEADKIKKQLALKDKEINDLKTHIENMKAQEEKKAALQEVPADMDEMKKEELELTQRIVKKRREEIILSQRVEAKRKEELALERKIEALKKKLKEMGS
ncbi:hypothetical protein KAW96_07495 [candidate division WOR-3 bacterium]|nr:hypothetical protein [candidate division WOR-3 bacterium]